MSFPFSTSVLIAFDGGGVSLSWSTRWWSSSDLYKNLELHLSQASFKSDGVNECSLMCSRRPTIDVKIEVQITQLTIPFFISCSMRWSRNTSESTEALQMLHVSNFFAWAVVALIGGKLCLAMQDVQIFFGLSWSSVFKQSAQVRSSPLVGTIVELVWNLWSVSERSWIFNRHRQKEKELTHFACRFISNSDDRTWWQQMQCNGNSITVLFAM